MQREVKLVLYTPTENFHTVDIYVDGNRVHCGRAYVTPEEALSAAKAAVVTALTNMVIEYQTA